MKRRTLFSGLIGGAAFGAVSPAMRLFADTPVPGFRFVSLFASGGWDVLIGLDARSMSHDAEHDVMGGGPNGKIRTGYDLLAPEYRPVQQTVGDSSVYLGGAMSSIWTAGHLGQLTIFRGANMNTVAHVSGRAYVNSFRQPAGVTPRGSSISTVMSTVGAVDSDTMFIPNVSIGMPSFNEDFPSTFSAVGANSPNDFRDIFSGSTRSSTLGNNAEALLARAQRASGSCVSLAYQRTRPEELVRANRRSVDQILERNMAAQFDLDNTDNDLRTTFPSWRTGAGRTAAVTYRLLQTGITRSVSARIMTGLDTHNTNWVSLQGVRQQQAWTAISELLTALKQDDPQLERTIVTVHSEFARTPHINQSGGRDHHFANSFAVFSGLLRPGVIGRTDTATLGVQNISLDSGRPQEGGTMLKPEHIGATLASAAGISPDSFRIAPISNWIR